MLFSEPQLSLELSCSQFQTNAQNRDVCLVPLGLEIAWVGVGSGANHLSYGHLIRDPHSSRVYCKKQSSD